MRAQGFEAFFFESVRFFKEMLMPWLGRSKITAKNALLLGGSIANSFRAFLSPQNLRPDYSRRFARLTPVQNERNSWGALPHRPPGRTGSFPATPHRPPPGGQEVFLVHLIGPPGKDRKFSCYTSPAPPGRTGRLSDCPSDRPTVRLTLQLLALFVKVRIPPSSHGRGIYRRGYSGRFAMPRQNGFFPIFCPYSRN